MSAKTSCVVSALPGVDAAFAEWAGIYDEQINPLLTLEERFLKRILPEIADLDVVDVGCGTGRWLRNLTTLHPRSLIGVDPSGEMLAVAAAKVGSDARCLDGLAEELPIAECSTDVILCSFVMSYVDPVRFVRELCRVARPGARIFVTDVHPHTAGALGWKRGFRKDNVSVELPAHNWPVEDVVKLFEAAGMRLTLAIEPIFGQPEYRDFEVAGREQPYEEAEGRPAIYILGFERPDSNPPSATGEADESSFSLSRCTVALGATESVAASLEIENGRVRSLTSDWHHPTSHPNIDLAGYAVFPGLINAHDHLEFALFPRMGGGPYRNAEDWAKDIHAKHADVIAQHRKVAKKSRLLWGALRNLLCGVTTVCHHNPLVPELLEEDFPIRVIRDVRWAHSFAFDREGVIHAVQSDSRSPFVLHLGEGTDARSTTEIYELDRRGGLDGRTVIVHGVALTATSLEVLNRRGAALVWCPSSNSFLFGRTHTQDFVLAAKRVALGSDSALTATGDLLDEVRFARDHVGVSACDLYGQITTTSANIFALRDGDGTIRPSGNADFVAVRHNGDLPAEMLAKASFREIELVIVGGRVQLASDEMMRRLPDPIRSELRPLEVEGEIRWVRLPLGEMFGDAVRELGCDIRLGGKRVRHVSTAWL